MSKGTKVFYWVGSLVPDNMNTGTWFNSWQKRALQERKDGFELVVFRIPLDQMGGMAAPGAIEEIELLLQEKFGTNSITNIQI